MIYVEMYGRLGNQFFRYAAARALQLKYYPDEKLSLNFNQVFKASETDTSFYNVLNDFNVSNYLIYKKSGKVIFRETTFMQKIICFLYYIRLRNIKTSEMNEMVSYEDKWKDKLMKYGLYWFRCGYFKLKKCNRKDKFISGNFESPHYFEEYRKIILKEFTPKRNVLPENVDLLKLIRSTNSVCVTVRRGDFESNKRIKKLHSVCNKQYFENAIKIIKEKLNDPVFFMFSDDIEWVKNNIDTGSLTYYETGNDPVWEKIRLMSSCKNFIISNSTFSWWAQYLSNHENKVVISPSRWFNNDYSSDLIDRNNWILIDV